MINLDVYDCCHDCCDFEPVVERIYNYGGSYPNSQIISCKHRVRCSMLCSYLYRKLKKKETPDA